MSERKVPGGGTRKLLTPTQLRVLTLVSYGHTAKTGAPILNMAPDTFRTHMERLHTRLGVHTNAEAVRRAFELGIFCVPRAKGHSQ